MREAFRTSTSFGLTALTRGVIALVCVTLAPGLGFAADPAAFNGKADKAVAAAIAPQQGAPPTKGPRLATGKHVIVIPCSMAAEGCARLTRGAMEAAGLVGWKVTMLDPGGDSARMAQAVQKAISIKADAIVLASIDAALVQGPLREAKMAGIVSVADGTNEDGLYAYTVFSHDFYFNQGYLVASAGYVFGGHRLRTLMLTDNEFAGVRTRAEGTVAFLNDCQAAGGDCKVLASENTLVAGLTTVVPQQAVSLVRRHPDYNSLWAGYDAALNFIIQGLRQADLAESGFAVGFDANVANIGLIQRGLYQRATLGAPLEWGGYAMIDTLNRLFAGESSVDEGISSRLLTKENIPASGIWQSDVDFRAAYRKLWGLP